MEEKAALRRADAPAAAARGQREVFMGLKWRCDAGLPSQLLKPRDIVSHSSIQFHLKDKQITWLTNRGFFVIFFLSKLGG